MLVVFINITLNAVLVCYIINAYYVTDMLITSSIRFLNRVSVLFSLDVHLFILAYGYIVAWFFLEYIYTVIQDTVLFDRFLPPLPPYILPIHYYSYTT